MRKNIYQLVNRLGFKIQNKNRERKRRIKYLSLFCDFTDNYEILIDSYEFILNLKNKFRDLKISKKEESYLVYFNSQQFLIQTREEFFILNEVYFSLDYEFFTDKEVIVFDIGANVGLATLFFSKKENVKQVFSFEPVEDTYTQAKKNFQLNPVDNQKIVVNNFGLAEEDKETFFVFDSDRKGRSGQRDDKKNILLLEDSFKRKVALKEASKILSPIIELNKESKFVVKMDCEGAEYEIFDNLIKSEVIKNIDIFMIEWHDKGAGYINSLLINSNFTVFNNYLTPVSGMIYAVKQS